MSTQRKLTPLAFAFLAGIVAGIALTWLFEPRTTEGPADTLSAEREAGRTTSSIDAPAAVLHTSGRPQATMPPGGPPDAAPLSGPPPAPPFEPPADLDLPPGVAGWIRVEVVPPPGTQTVSGSAYVLAAGARGVDDIDLVPHAYPNSEEPVQIPLGRPGRYDVGFLWNQSVVLRQDVTVVAGETTTVVIQPPAPQRLTVTLAGPLPQRAGWQTSVEVRLSPSTSRRVVTCPGRGERRNVGSANRISIGTHTLGHLLPGERVHVRAYVWYQRSTPKSEWVSPRDVVVVARPSEAGLGDRVSLRVVPTSVVHVTATLDPASWPGGVVRHIQLDIEHAGGQDTSVHDVEGSVGATAEDVYGWSFRVPEGPVTVRWHGPDIRSGTASSFNAIAGKTHDVAVDLAFTGRRVPGQGRPLYVDVAWPKRVGDDATLELAGVAPRGPDDDPEIPTWSFEPGEDASESTPEMRRVRTVVGWIGDAYATGPIRLPTSDTLHVRPQRGGLLILAPEVVRSEEMGQYVLRRADGLPIRSSGGSYAVDLPVQAGGVIGPFLPGAHTFQVWLGSQRLADATVTVRAGRSTALVLKE